MTQEAPKPIDRLSEAKLLPLASSLMFRVDNSLSVSTEHTDSFPEFDSERLMEAAGKK